MIFYDCNAKISKYIIITTQYVKRELTYDILSMYW